MLARMTLTVVVAAFGLAACNQAPEPAPGVTAEHDVVPFRARIAFDTTGEIPADSRLISYVVEADFADGTRRVVAEKTLPASGESPVMIGIEVPRAELDPERGYDMFAVVVDSQGRQLMSAAANRAPVPATGLHFENTFNLRLLPLATPAPPAEVFRLAGEPSFDCGEFEVRLRQQDDGEIIATLAGFELALRPAVATSGGRFSDGLHELWLTDESQGFLIMPGEPPRPCTQR